MSHVHPPSGVLIHSPDGWLPDPGGLLLQLLHDPQDPHVPGVGAVVGAVVPPGGGGGGGGGGGYESEHDPDLIQTPRCVSQIDRAEQGMVG